MLSIENPLLPPRDPPSCSPTPQISVLKNNSSNTSGGGSSSDDDSDDNKASCDKLHLVDLLKSDHHPPPKFSIRDYVFNTRSKDIENHWPFSEENLQLCLKHGVKDLLPPFQSPDTVGKPPFLGTCSISDTKGIICSFNAQNQDDDHGVFVDFDCAAAGCNPNIAAAAEGDKEFRSTITSQTCSEIDSVPTNKSPEFEADQEVVPAAKSDVVIPAPAAASNRTQAQVKKCKLVVKLGNSSNLSTKEDNNFMVSESAAMASKVCPVCKTFSSSSNTTLNAHIDQCLSGEPATRWSSDSKVIKHRIKPRKMKSMVEIYATAPHCTLEELDRRNGTNWATTNSILPAKNVEAAGTAAVADQKKQSSPADHEETPDEGAVYIDANGTKLRILSKSNDPPSLLSKGVDVSSPKKLVNRDKVIKSLSPKKKKQIQVQKRHKLIKHGKISYSRPDPTPFEINDDNQDKNFSGEESFEACETQPSEAQDEVKFGRPDMIRGWACSKRTSLNKKSSGRDESQLSGNSGSRDLSFENNRFSVGSSHVKNGCGRRTASTFENSLSSPRSNKQTDKSSYVTQDDEIREPPSLRKRARIAAVESPVSLNRERSLVVAGIPGHNIKKSRKDKPHNQEDVLFERKRKVQVHSGQDSNANHPDISPKSSSGQNTHSTKGRMSASLRNKSSVVRASGLDSKFYLKKKHSAFKKSAVHCLTKPIEEAGYGRERMRRTHYMISVDENRNLKTRKTGGENMIARKEESRGLKTSQSKSMSYPRDAEDHDGSFMLGSVSGSRSDDVESAEKNMDTSEEDFDMEAPSEDATGAAFMDFRNSMDTQFHQLGSSSDGHCESERFSEVHKETPHFEDEAPTCSAEPILSAGQEMFCAAEIPENMNVVAELDSSGMRGNYFAEVDPIPIPGPPGSFLPSPGHMDSEDLPGNSSLTSSRIQSSDDRQELVDQSSDSPVSALSAISNSTMARSDPKSSGTLLVGCPPVMDGFMAAANGNNSIVESSSPVLLDNSAGAAERSTFDKGVYRLKDPPCCCSRKEGFSQSVSLNFEESQLLRRRTMAAAEVVLPANRKEMTCDIDRRLLDSNRSEMSSVIGRGPGDDAGIKSPAEHVQRIAADSLVKFPSHNGCEPNSPPTPSPVLRLMGKNLMVVNKDESVVSSQMKPPPQLSSILGHSNSHILPVPGGVSIGGNACHVASSQVVPYSLGRAAAWNKQSEWSDGYSSSHEIARTSQMLALISPAMLSTSRGAVDGLVGSSYLPGMLSSHGINADADELARSPGFGWRNAANAMKEIIVIDDSPDNEHDPVAPATAHNQGMIQGMESGKPVAMNLAAGGGSRHPTNLYGYPQYDSAATYCGSPGVDASFRIPSNNVANGPPAKWNWTPPEGSIMTTSSSAAQMRPKFYSYSNFK